MNPGMDGLQPYPFQRLGRLFGTVEPADMPGIFLTVGEPQHAPPEFILEDRKSVV